MRAFASLIVGVVIASSAGCSASGGATEDTTPRPRAPRTEDSGFEPISCPEGTCLTDGFCGPCTIEPPDGGPKPPGGTCDLAPSCPDGLGLPAGPKEIQTCSSLERKSYGCGEDLGVHPSKTTCADPTLKLRIARIRTPKPKDGGFLGGNKVDLFCVVEASDATTSELLVTSLHKNFGRDSDLLLTPKEGIFWGQNPDALKSSASNLTITYRCYENKEQQGILKFLDVIGKVAAVGSGVRGNPYGRYFEVAGEAAAVLTEAIKATQQMIVKRLEVQQTIHANAFLEMTKGKTWSIRQTAPGGDWTWELLIEAWGCSGTTGSVP
jgi:hypothetical protein